METVTLASEPREGRGKRAAKKHRKGGMIPAVLYGHKEAVVSVMLPRKEFETALRHRVRVIDLAAGGKTETAIIQEVQYDHLGKEVLHVDFKRVSKDERVTVPVRIELKGTAPGQSAGVLDQPLHELEIDCLAINIPESIKVNIGSLQLDQAIHVKDVPLPEGVVCRDDPDAIVVQIRAAAAEPETAAAPAEAAGTEPEIVGRRVKEEEAEE